MAVTRTPAEKATYSPQPQTKVGETMVSAHARNRDRSLHTTTCSLVGVTKVASFLLNRPGTTE